MRFAVQFVLAGLTFLATAAEKGPEPADRATLEIVVSGFASSEGCLKLAMHNSSSSFLSKNTAQKPFLHLSLSLKDRKCQDGKCQQVIKDLPPGEYAVTVFHDEDDNGKLDTNFLGIPKEAVGFSGNARVKFGPPSYEQAKFILGPGHQVQQIQIKKIF